MIKVKPTKHLIGVTIEGDFDDLYSLTESIYNMTYNCENTDDVYYGVKNRLLGLCYDLRHAYQGDRNIVFKDNGMDNEKMKYHQTITPVKNVYYSAEVYFPEAIFIAASVPKMYALASSYYGNKKDETNRFIKPYSKYIEDKANLNLLFSKIWAALSEAIGNEEAEKILRLNDRTNESFFNYATNYIDKCNIELFKCDVQKRKDKLRNIAKRIVKKPQSYYNLENDLKYWAKEYNTSIYNLEDPSIKYPDEIDW